MSIMPGIESRAPERTETSSGFFVSPNFVPMIFSMLAHAVFDLRLAAPCGYVRLLCVVVRADFGGDREARRHRQADAGHLREVRALAAEQRLHLAVAVRFPVAEIVNVFRCFRPRRLGPVSGIL